METIQCIHVEKREQDEFLFPVDTRDHQRYDREFTLPEKKVVPCYYCHAILFAEMNKQMSLETALEKSGKVRLNLNGFEYP